MIFGHQGKKSSTERGPLPVCSFVYEKFANSFPTFAPITIDRTFYCNTKYCRRSQIAKLRPSRTMDAGNGSKKSKGASIKPFGEQTFSESNPYVEERLEKPFITFVPGSAFGGKPLIGSQDDLRRGKCGVGLMDLVPFHHSLLAWLGRQGSALTLALVFFPLGLASL